MKKILVVLSLALAPASAFSAVETSTDSSRLPGFLDDMYLNYFTTVHGSPLNELGSVHTVDRNGAQNAASGVNLDSEITGAYMVRSTTGIGASIPFVAVPVLGQGIILGDIGLKAFDRDTISYEGFHLSNTLILQAPTSKSSRDHDMILGLKYTPSIRYSMSGSRFTFGAWTEAKQYFGVSSDKTFKLYAQPYASYRFLPTLSANVGFEMEWRHYAGESAGNLSMYQTDLEPGVIWNITPKIMLNPYLQFYTTNRLSLDTAAVGATFSATIL